MKDAVHKLLERQERSSPVACTDAGRSTRSTGNTFFFFGWVTLVFILLLDAIPAPGQTNLQKAHMGTVTNANTSTTNSGWSHLKYAIYFTYPEIEKLLADSASLRETMEYLAPIKPRRVYLECSNNEDFNVTLVKNVADELRAQGIKVTGAMVPTVPGGPMCYNNPEHLALLERRARALAQVFDEFILDDWLFTTCTCEKCFSGRGRSSWADYRTKLILEKSKKYIIDPAKQIKPGIRVIIKYPNWYEGHRENGYDVFNETHQFDAMVAGIETRTRATHDQHIPIYSGYVFQKWWSSVDPGKWIGTWLDNYSMKGQDNDYVAQVWQAVMAQTPEIILWSGGHLHYTGPFSDVYPHFREMLPEFDRVAGMLNGPARGVPIYLPYGSEGEYNIFGYLGMAGIPLTPVGQFPADSHTAIFTKHSLKDAELADKMLARLRNGRDVFLTWELFRQLQSTEFRNTVNLVDAGGSVSSSMFRTRIGWSDQVTKTDRAFVFPRISTTTWPYAREVAVVREDYDFGVLLSVKYLNGTLYILNMPENSYDLLRLPAQALNMIRHAFDKELGVQLAGPGGVGMYLFGPSQYVLYNMNDEPAPVSLRFDQEVSSTGWRELVHGKQLAVSEEKSRERFGGRTQNEISLTLQPFEITIVQAP